MKAIRHRALFVMIASTLALVAACKAKPPKQGDKCKEEGKFVCTDATSRMVCTSGKYVLEKCGICEQTTSRGFGSKSSMSTFAGCVPAGIGPEGASCEGETTDCDGNTLVKCLAGKYRHFPCSGPGACKHDMQGVSCDTTIAAPAQACRDDGGACSADHQAMLTCTNGAFLLDRTCRGPKGCTVTQDAAQKSKSTITCDSAIADINDPCVGDGGACSLDKKSILKCEKEKYVVYKPCRGPTPECRLEGTKVQCATPAYAEIGDPCENGSACTTDGKAFLQCKNGAMALRSKCKTCKINGSNVDCTF